MGSRSPQELGIAVAGMYLKGYCHTCVTGWLEETFGQDFRTLFVLAQTEGGPRWVARGAPGAPS